MPQTIDWDFTAKMEITCDWSEWLQPGENLTNLTSSTVVLDPALAFYTGAYNTSVFMSNTQIVVWLDLVDPTQPAAFVPVVFNIVTDNPEYPRYDKRTMYIRTFAR